MPFLPQRTMPYYSTANFPIPIPLLCLFFFLFLLLFFFFSILIFTKFTRKASYRYSTKCRKETSIACAPFDMAPTWVGASKAFLAPSHVLSPALIIHPKPISFFKFNTHFCVYFIHNDVSLILFSEISEI